MSIVPKEVGRPARSDWDARLCGVVGTYSRVQRDVQARTKRLKLTVLPETGWPSCPNATSSRTTRG